MAEAPWWPILVAPIITALATWITTKFELLSLRRIKEYEGLWYAYYLDPDTKSLEKELWSFTSFGNVTVSRNGERTFKGTLSLRGNKAYMNVDSTLWRGERLFVMLDAPNNPRTGDQGAVVCIWLGKSADQTTTAGHGILSREELDTPEIKNEFLRARSTSQELR
jgi:hypothetical protein